MMAGRIMTVIELAELICKGSLERTESRWAHYRSDYPEMDRGFDKNYMHQVVGGDVVSSWKDIPGISERLQDWLDTFERTQNYGHSE